MITSRKIYLYIKGNNYNDVISFLEVYEEFSVRKIQGSYLEITTDSLLDIETMSKARDFSMVELYQDFTAFISPLNFDFKIQDILEVLPDLTPGIHTIETLIPEVVLLNKIEFLIRLKDYYYNKFSPEVIQTILGFIDQNMNASKTAKVLFMHRNTLNYRLDNFINKTELDVRSFKGAVAIYLLFKR